MERKPKYVLCHITTSDEELLKKADELRSKKKLTHEDIYRKGVEEYSKE
jgi:hypothetical protein